MALPLRRRVLARVCPKGVDPAKAIQLMKRELVLDYLHLHKQALPGKGGGQAQQSAPRGDPRGAGEDRVEIAAGGRTGRRREPTTGAKALTRKGETPC